MTESSLPDRRSFLAAAAGGAVMAAAGPALAAREALGAEVTRSGDALRLSWTGARLPASIHASSDPDAPASLMRPLRSGLVGGRAEVRFPARPRPYFLVQAGAGQTRTAERLLPLQGGRNFRDLGGYRTEDGRQVRWGRLYRSGVMNGLTAADMTYLNDLGIRVICDLRSRRERDGAPNPFLAGDALPVVATDYELDQLDSRRAMTRDRREAVELMGATYLDLTHRLQPQLTDMFARLARRETPLAFNCTAGKDRTGMASALILSVLGVPRDTIVADYALTARYLPPANLQRQLASGSGAAGSTPEMAKAILAMSPETQAVMLGSEPDTMRSALAQIDRQYGSPIALTKALFGMTDAKIADLRRTYLA